MDQTQIEKYNWAQLTSQLVSRRFLEEAKKYFSFIKNQDGT